MTSSMVTSWPCAYRSALKTICAPCPDASACQEKDMELVIVVQAAV